LIFDVRLLTKSYGRLFLKSLPACKLVHRLEAIDEFLVPPTMDIAQNHVKTVKSNA
jgi:hypothetical protein